jgi:hypothetical protein
MEFSHPWNTDSMEFLWNTDFYGFHGFFSQLVKSAPQQPWPKKYDMDF